jgi:hypothetical protein
MNLSSIGYNSFFLNLLVSLLFFNCTCHRNHSGGQNYIDGVLYDSLPKEIKNEIKEKISFPGIEEIEPYYSLPVSSSETLEKARSIGLKNLRRFYRFTYNKESWPVYLATIEAYVDSVIDMGMTNTLWINFSIDKTYPKTDEEIEVFSDYCEHIAQGLKGKIQMYIIFGEINRVPTLTPEEFMKVIKRVIPNIRKVDSDVIISAFSLNKIDYGYMEKLLELGLTDYVDRVSLNPYIYGPPERKQRNQLWQYWKPILPDEPQSIYGFESEIKEYQKLVRSFNPTVEFDIGEFGWSTDRIAELIDNKLVETTDPERTSYLQAIYLARRMILLIDLNFRSVCYWTDRDKKPDPGKPAQGVGILDENGEPKRSFFAYETINKVFYEPRKLEKPQFNIKITDNLKDIQFHAFLRGNYELLLTAWSFEQDTVTITIDNSEFLYPVKIPLFDHENIQSLKYYISLGSNRIVIRELPIGEEPLIIRLVRKKL